MCDLSRDGMDTALDSLRSRPLVTPTLYSRDQLNSLVASEMASVRAIGSQLFQVPLSILRKTSEVDPPLTIHGLMGLRAPVTTLSQVITDVPFPANTSLREWFSFSWKPCWTVGGQALCDRLPYCSFVYDDDVELKCQSQLCPFNASMERCESLPQCIFVGGDNTMPPGVTCIDRPCESSNSLQSCFNVTYDASVPSALRAIDPPGRCSLKATPESGRVCQARALGCDDFHNAHDCMLAAPSFICTWNTTSSACEYIAKAQCVGNAPACNISQLQILETSKYMPVEMASTWATQTLAAYPDAIRELGQQQPDYIVFQPARETKTSKFHLTSEPLWRLAVNSSLDGGCDCFTNPDCTSAEVSVQMDPRDPFNSSWTFHCSRLATVESWATISLLSKVWNRTQQGLRIPQPLHVASQFETVGDAMQHGFLLNVSANTSFQRYFKQCDPSYCAVNLPVRRSAIEVISATAGLVGGLAVVIRAIVTYSVSFCCKQAITAHVLAYPDVYGPIDNQKTVEMSSRNPIAMHMRKGAEPLWLLATNPDSPSETSQNSDLRKHSVPSAPQRRPKP